MDASSSSLDVRVELLERQLRWFKRMSVLALVALVAVGATHSTSAVQKVLTIADAHGHARVKIDAGGIHMYDSRGKERMRLTIADDGQPQVQLKDASETPRLGLALVGTGGFKGGGGIGFFGADGQQQSAITAEDINLENRAYLGVTREGTPAVQLYDTDNNVIWSAPPQ